MSGLLDGNSYTFSFEVLAASLYRSTITTFIHRHIPFLVLAEL